MTAPEPDLVTRIVRYVEDFPGTHLRELARQLGVSEALAGYHLDHLVHGRLLRSETQGGYRRLYPASTRGPTTRREKSHLALLRQRVPLRIVLILLERGSASHTDLGQALGLSKGAVTYQLHKLMEADLVRASSKGVGFELADRAGVERLLRRWKPTPDPVERFAELWENFYAHGRKR